MSLWFDSYNSPGTSFDYELFDAQLPNSDAYDVQLCGGVALCGFTGIHGSVGTGVAMLSSTVNFPFKFVAYRPYNLVEAFSTTGWTIYMDGANVSSGNYSDTPTIAGSSDYIEIGGGATASSYFYGQIGDVQVYNSVLTAAQVRQLWQQGVSPQSSVTLSLG